MNRLTKHTIILLCFLLSLAQAAHLYCHVFSSDHNNNKDILHVVDNHKCSICENSFTPLLFNNELENFSWIKLENHTKINEFLIQVIKEDTTLNLKLRGPPYLIV